MHTLFIELYKRLSQQIDDNRNNTHSIKDVEKYGWNKKECKKEIAKVLNSKPEELEPLFSRLAKCAAIPTMHYDAHVFDETKDKNFTSILEYHNGCIESGFSGLSFLVEFEDGDEVLDESVYIRISDSYEFYVYDLKPYNICNYKKNTTKIEDTSKDGIFRKEHPGCAIYIDKWIKSDKDLHEELSKWSDMLWLGRHLCIKGDIDEWPEDIRNGALAAEKQIIEKWGNDPDFKKYMYDDGAMPDESFGDTHWKEISCNVGALRYLLCGEWNLDS